MKILTEQQIKDFLETAPLYSWKTFSQPEKPRNNIYINEVEEFCETCSQVKPFQNKISYGGDGGIMYSGHSAYSFTCVSCDDEKHTFWVQRLVTERNIKLQKVGQLPRKKLERDSKLQKFFKSDADYYEKALISLNNGYGIAAFAYFRRIVESNILSLLDLLASDVDPKDKTSPFKSAIDQLRIESPMSDKIKIANNALPEYLKPDGLNPLGKIYGLLSEGVHSLSDEQCLTKAENLQACLCFLVTELASRKKNKESFKSMVGKLKSS